MDIAELLKTSRKSSGYSIKDAVQKLEDRGVHISDKTMYSWESGHRQPDADTFVELCMVYGITSLADINKEAPETETPESEADLQERVQMLTDAFERCGYIPKGGDLTDDQLKFCMGLVDFLDTYFGG